MRKVFQQNNSGAITDTHIIAGDMIITVSIKVDNDQKQRETKAKIQLENINLIQVNGKRWQIKQESRQMTAKMKTSTVANMKIS